MNANSQQHDRDVGPLGLTSVLVDSLPRTLLTRDAPDRDAPDRYTVEAVFTRKPLREELDQLLGGATRDILARDGYSTVELTVSDRRLEIANTRLEELRDGLAAVLATRLAEISIGVKADRDADALRFRAASDAELARGVEVAELAATVQFVPHQRFELDDETRREEWDDEGGAPARGNVRG